MRLTSTVARHLDPEAAAVALYEWRLWARPEQIEPEGDWTVWLYLAGRGAGKTRSGAEWVREQVEAGVQRIGLIAPTAADARDVMVEGPSGILAVCPPWNEPHYEPSKRRITWPNGAVASVYSADEPDRLRGPQHEIMWCDEIAAWRRMGETWDNALLGLRMGARPRAMLTTTPRPRLQLKKIMDSPVTHVSRGSTLDNLPNLAPTFRDEILSRYEGTRIGRQEIHGEYLDDIPGALWTRKLIDEHRVADAPELARIVVPIDPAVSSGEAADDTGIVIPALGIDGQYYVISDRTCHLSPDGWARRAVTAYHELEADRVVAEVNNGGDLVERVIRTVDPDVPYRAVRASRGKIIRAEPIAALYEQGKVHHVGDFPELEDEMCSFTPESGWSPNRLDSLVWGITDLVGNADTSWRGEWLKPWT